jgi:hypothetical protein
MRRTTLSIRFLTLGLAVAATACRSTPAHAQPAALPVEPVPSAEPFAAERSSASASAATSARPAQDVDDPHATTQNAATSPPRAKTIDAARGKGRSATPRQNSPNDAYGRALGAFRAGNYVSPAAAAAESVAVVSTEPMDAATGDEWREDLVVMDKLLHDAFSSASTVAGMQRMVLGLAIKTSGNRVPPTYIEGAGVVFTTSASFPLVPDENATTRPDRTRQQPSAWNRAKRELNGDGRSGVTWFGADAAADFTPPVEFEQAKVDALVEAVVKALPEATNFRHLKDGEHVFVTVVGYGESGVPARLTLKAKKADIDAASRGTITPEEFKSRVVSRVSVASSQSLSGNSVVPRMSGPQFPAEAK